MNKRPIRVGVIGTGRSAAVHLPGLRQIPDLEIVAVSGSDGGSLTAVAERYGVDQCFDDYRAMFRDAGLDAVTIGGPIEQRHAMVISACEHGLHILCDAPMARNAAEARDMHRLARDVSIQHVVSFAARFTPARVHFKQLVDSGFLGALQSVSVTAFRSASSTSGARRHSRDDGDGESLVHSLGAEYVDVLRWWFGEIHGVAGARAEESLSEIGAAQPDANFAMVLQFAGGAVGSFHASASCPADLGDEVVAVGTGGMLGLRGDAQLYGTRRDGQDLMEISIPDELRAAAPRSPDQRVGSFTVVAYEWIRGITTGECHAPTFEDGMKVQEVIDGATRSQDLARWVDTSGKRWPV